MTGEKTIPLKFARGACNRTREDKVPSGYLSSAINVDITADGAALRRDGYVREVALTGANSLWSVERLDFALVAAGGNLYTYDGGGALTQVATGLNGSDVHYCDTPLGVYWSDGTNDGKVRSDGTGAAWGVPAPGVFSATATTAGGLYVGTYAVTITFVDTNGEESGAPSAMFVDVSDGGGVAVDTPAAPDSSIVEVRVYVSTANGQELQYAGSVVPGSTYNVANTPRGRALRTLYLRQLPALRHPFLKNGRLFGVAGRMVVWSEALHYGIYDSSSNYIITREAPIMAAPVDEQGHLVYIGTATRTYRWSGDTLETSTLVPVSHRGVVPGSMTYIAPDVLDLEGVSVPTPVWIDKLGVPQAGTANGLVPLSDKFAYPIFSSAAAVFDQREGRSRYLVSGRGGTPSVLAVSDYVTATVVDAGGGP